MKEIINDYIKDRKMLYVFLAGFVLGSLFGRWGVYIIVIAFGGYLIWKLLKKK